MPVALSRKPFGNRAGATTVTTRHQSFLLAMHLLSAECCYMRCGMRCLAHHSKQVHGAALRASRSCSGLAFTLWQASHAALPGNLQLSISGVVVIWHGIQVMQLSICIGSPHVCTCDLDFGEFDARSIPSESKDMEKSW